MQRQGVFGQFRTVSVTTIPRSGGLFIRISRSDGPNHRRVISLVLAVTAAALLTTLVAVPADAAAAGVNGKVLFASVANGDSLDVAVPVGTYSVEMPARATSPVVLDPLALPVRAGYLTRVFAIGQPSTKSMNVVVKPINKVVRR
jgi:hypothetical protein